MHWNMMKFGNEYNCCKCQCTYKDYALGIMKAESEIANTLSWFLEETLCDLKDLEPIDKRVNVAEKLISAISCKEKAMAELVTALNGYKRCR